MRATLNAHPRRCENDHKGSAPVRIDSDDQFFARLAVAELPLLAKNDQKWVFCGYFDSLTIDLIHECPLSGMYSLAMCFIDG